MTLEEILPEIRKGRKFKRAQWSEYYLKSLTASLSVESMFADDWELEPIKREISREDLAKAWDTVSAKLGTKPATESHAFPDLCKELGL